MAAYTVVAEPKKYKKKYLAINIKSVNEWKNKNGGKISHFHIKVKFIYL